MCRENFLFCGAAMDRKQFFKKVDIKQVFNRIPVKQFFKNTDVKQFFITNTKKIAIGGSAVVLLFGAAFGGWQYWRHLQPKFQDLTIELGTASLGIDQFATKYANPRKCRFVSDVSTLDIGKVGEYDIVMGHGKQAQTVCLSVVDTTVPQVTFTDRLMMPSNYVPKAKDFVESYSDLSEVTIAFAKAPENVDHLSDRTFTVVVSDACGNTTQQQCRLSYQWLKDSYQMEYGTQITAEDLVLRPEEDAERINDRVIQQLNSADLGTYTVKSISGNAVRTCSVTITDTTGPVIQLQPVSVLRGGTAQAEDFIVDVTDPSGVKDIRMTTQLEFQNEGMQKVEFVAEDIYGNISTAETEFYISMDTDPPVISGLYTLRIQKNTTPNYYSGVSAYDEIDGACAIRYSAPDIDTSKPGTYYVTYYATDKSNNTGSARRKVIVLHDETDTQALVNALAPTLNPDPEALRDYVRSTIKYNTEWGGDDPVWYGFTEKYGNCYVHAMCLNSLLQYYGYSTKLIWTTCKTHYWLLINLGGTWRHIDATPSNTHSIYSLMTDGQRLSTLKGRVWDTSLWPACN